MATATPTDREEITEAATEALAAIKRLWLVTIDKAEPYAKCVLKEEFVGAATTICDTLRSLASPETATLLSLAMKAARAKIG